MRGEEIAKCKSHIASVSLVHNDSLFKKKKKIKTQENHESLYFK